MARYGYDFDYDDWNRIGYVPDPGRVYRPGTGWGSIGGRRQWYDREMHFRGEPTNLQNHGRGWIHGYDRDLPRGVQPRMLGRYARDFQGRGHVPTDRRGYSGDFRDDPRTHGLSGMESNRMRGVYGSDFHLPRFGWERGHGGYRGQGWDRGGGMNPGRRDPRERR